VVKPAELPAAIERMLRSGLNAPELNVDAVRSPGPAGAFAASPRGQKHGGDENDIEGVLALDVTVRDTPAAAQRVIPLVLKTRHRAGFGETTLPTWLEAAGVRLDRPLEEHPTLVEFLVSGRREIDAYRRFSAQEETRGLLPEFLGAHVDEGADEYLLLVERVENAMLMDSVDDVSRWHPPMTDRFVDALAPLHAMGLGRAPDGVWPAGVADSASVLADTGLFRALLDAGRRSLPRVVTTELYPVASRLIDTLPDWYPEKDGLPKTLVHDDCNPRNACFRADRSPVLYDWELALWDTPQRDLAELLAFTLKPGFEVAALWEPVERHRRALSRAAGIELDADSWREGFRIQIRYELINRLAWQWLFAASTTGLAYVPRVTAVTAEIIRRVS